MVKRRLPSGSFFSENATKALGDVETSQSSKGRVVRRMWPLGSTMAARRRPSFDTTNQYPESPMIFSGVEVKLEISAMRGFLPVGGPTRSCTLPSSVNWMVANLPPVSSKAKASCKRPLPEVTLPDGLSSLGAAKTGAPTRHATKTSETAGIVRFMGASYFLAASLGRPNRSNAQEGNAHAIGRQGRARLQCAQCTRVSWSFSSRLRWIWTDRKSTRLNS